MGSPRRTRHSEATIAATARLLRTWRVTAGLTQAEAAVKAGEHLGKPYGLTDRTWIRAEEGHSLHGTLPAAYADGQENQQSAALANLPPETQAPMALAVDIPPDELREVGRSDAADLMGPFERAAELRRPRQRLHPLLADLNDKLLRLDEQHVERARTLVDMCTAGVDQVLEDQPVVAPRQRQRSAA